MNGNRGRKVIQKISKWKILRGDTVQVMAGKDKGKVGNVLGVYKNRSAVIVEGLNLITKHIKGTDQSPGGRIQRESPIHYSNIAVIDPSTGGPCRIGWKFLEDGTKVRVSKDSGNVIPRPENITERKFERVTGEGEKTTKSDIASSKTYDPTLFK